MKYLTNNLIYIILGIFLLFFAFVPRSVEVLNKNYVFLLDQGRDYMQVKDLVDNKKITLIGSEIGGGYAGINGIFQGPVHYYFESIFYVLFHGDPYGGIVYMFLFGLATVFFSFFFAKSIFKSVPAGFIMAFLVAASPPLIAQSRFVWNPYPSSLFILLAYYFTYKLQNKKKLFIFLASFFAAFIYNFEIAITVPLLISLAIYLLLVIKIRKPLEYISFIAGALIAFIPMILFEVRHNFLAIHGALKYLSTPPDPHSHYSFINNHLSSFVYNIQDTFPKQTIIPWTIFILIFICAGIYFFIQEKRPELKKFLIFAFIVMGTSILIFSFLRNNIFMYYLFHLNVLYIFFFTYILTTAYYSKKYLLEILFILLLGIFLITGAIIGVKTFQYDLRDYGGDVKIKGKKAAIDFIYQDAHGKPFGLFIFMPGVVTYPYDYVVVWYGQKKYGYLPTKDKNGLFYLLIQKDQLKPWADNGWKETVIKTGKILEQKTLPSGLVVEKRCGENCPM